MEPDCNIFSILCLLDSIQFNALFVKAYKRTCKRKFYAACNAVHRPVQIARFLYGAACNKVSGMRQQRISEVMLALILAVIRIGCCLDQSDAQYIILYIMTVLTVI